MNLDNLEAETLLGDATESNVPPPVLASAPVMDMSFHPQLPILAAGLITGEVEIFERKRSNEMSKIPLQNDFSSWIFKSNYAEDAVVLNYHHQNMMMHPSGGVSGMEFTDDGAYLVSVSSDRSISVMDCVSLRLVIHIPSSEVAARGASKRGLNAMNKKNDPSVKGTLPVKTKKTKKGQAAAVEVVNPHKYGISALNVCDENIIATGDDDGLISIWDMRDRRPAHVYHEHGDHISQLCYFTDVQELVSSSGDTCLGVYDLRGGKVRDFSQRRKDELNCFAFINCTGVSNATFIPSIICATPHGGLPMWKYGSWARPYDILEQHPAECESIISFHGEDTSFNHNIILTGACDGLVRVLQMYPVRRNLCQLSARDYTYSHSNSLGANSSRGDQQSNFVVRRARGQEAIHRMRVSHDSSMLAVTGADHIIDFVDVSFLNSEEALDQLRGKAEQRHLKTLREIDRERDEEEERERQLMEGHRSGTSDDDTDASSDDSLSSTDSSSSSSSSSNSSSDDDDSDDSAEKSDTLANKGGRKVDMLAMFQRHQAAKAAKRQGRHLCPNVTSTTAANAVSTAGEKRKRDNADDPSASAAAKSAKTSKITPQNSAPAQPKTSLKNKSAKSTKSTTKSKEKGSSGDSFAGHQVNSASVAKERATGEEETLDSMEVYRSERAKNRERAAAGRWLKEERRKKINFTFEKRRRRVGGFFGDMANHDD